ncbi:MAG: hypothetical protein IJS01_14350 [Lentisphaeria bacterium]|nr:hypothetical protein [Lentisphaeria bacterium]
MRKGPSPISKFLRLLLPVFLAAAPLSADAGLSPTEKSIAASALEKSDVYEQKHIVLVWPKDLRVKWCPESNVKDPRQLAEWLERCYTLCVRWLDIDPDRQLNAGRPGGRRARLIFIHNGMRDYNFGGRLPRPVIGLRDLRGVGSEDWFGWLTHELSHEFFLRFPKIVGSDENNAWHEALCDYMRYWLLKESGMPAAAANWRQALRRASRKDRYKGGADIIMTWHEEKGFRSPAELWRAIKDRDLSTCFGKAPWLREKHVTVPEGAVKITFEGVIDGAGSFTFRGSKVYYEHFTWQYPSRVKIDGRPWKDLDRPFELGFTPDFATARPVDRQGRGTMALVVHPNRFVLFIDDTENGAAPYRMILVVGKGK